MSTKPRLIVILGPTATGKTKVATHLAAKTGGEVISADSRQVYRQMDIGTGKDLSEYMIEGQSIPYHLIDICNPGEDYNVNRFQQDFTNAFLDINSRSRQAILCGGTGLYLQAVLEGYRITSVPEDFQLREKLSVCSKKELLDMIKIYSFPEEFKPDSSSMKRLIRAIEVGEYLKLNPEKEIEKAGFEPVLFGLKVERELRRKWITERLQNRLNSGLIEEVEGLIGQGVAKDKLRFYGLEYKFVTDYLDKQIDRNQLFEKLNIAIHQFAKRQMTWFRKMEREGYEISWIDATCPLDEKLSFIAKKLNSDI